MLIILMRSVPTNECKKKFRVKVLKANGYNSQGGTYSQPAFTCSKLTIETLEQGVKYVQS